MASARCLGVTRRHLRKGPTKAAAGVWRWRGMKEKEKGGAKGHKRRSTVEE
eukprot:gene9602-4173_t